MARNNDDLLRWGYIEKAIMDYYATQKNSAYVIPPADTVESVLYILEDVPSVDAEPAKHGRWVKEEDRRNHWHCSECMYVGGLIHSVMKYCPNCGSRMEVEE